jgi:hypothetical protein
VKPFSNVLVNWPGLFHTFATYEAYRRALDSMAALVAVTKSETINIVIVQHFENSGTFMGPVQQIFGEIAREGYTVTVSWKQSMSGCTYPVMDFFNTFQPGRPSKRTVNVSLVGSEFFIPAMGKPAITWHDLLSSHFGITATSNGRESLDDHLHDLRHMGRCADQHGQVPQELIVIRPHAQGGLADNLPVNCPLSA